MKYRIDSKQANLALAIHAVVGATQSHDQLSKTNTQAMYDDLSDGLGGVGIPKLIYMVDRQVATQGLKSFTEINQKGFDKFSFDINQKTYADLTDFYPFAEVLYLTTVAYNISHHLSQIGINASKEDKDAYIEACAEQAVADLLAATRVLDYDTEDYPRMPCIMSNDNPVSYLHPMIYMNYSMLMTDTLDAIKNRFGSGRIEKFVSTVNQANYTLMLTSSSFKNQEISFNYD